MEETLPGEAGGKRGAAARSFIAVHETLGSWYIPNLRTLHRTATGDWLLETNSIGLRDSRDFSKQADPGRTRILLFGDSFTFGQGVSASDRYSDQMEARHSELEIINFGHIGSGTDVQYLIYRELGRQYGGDVLMINPHVSNITRNVAREQVRTDHDGRPFTIAKPYFDLDDEGLTLHNVPVPKERNYLADPSASSGESRLVRMRHSFLNRSAAKYRALRFLPVQPFPQYETEEEPAWRITRAILERWVSEAGGRTVVIAPLPGWYNVINPRLANYVERFVALADPDASVHVVDVLPAFWSLSFSDQKRCFLSAEDGHYSRFGHSVVAEVLLDALDRLGVLDRQEGRRAG